MTTPVFLAAAALMFLVLPGTASADSSVGQWQWPVSPDPAVLRHFEPPPQKWMPGHRGVDLASVEAGGILSPAGGVVAFVGTVVDRPVITLDHGDGVLSSFEPVSSSLVKGEEVTEGQVIGQLSTEAHCPVACVHWGVRLNGEYVNPLNYVSDRRPSILLPLDG
ncbi:M23 family metallopeptidase [Arthrobacter sp. H5]|uniref:M23 family metallopeptidase n=1 Tax=Arthrobacter sp. H5 TaxID=1267973 RepID=UPI0009E04F08|nr:M23 family metallopeptidase [Arthrobacter sp. H5]